MGQVFGKSESIDFNAEVELRHFNLLRCVGKGAFGKVRIVEHRESKKLYALKYINKLQCIRIKAVPNIIRERYIFEEIEHPFIVNLRYAFQDDENMFMVLDLMMGGDLRYHLDRLGGFTEEMIRFFASEISCALNYLHNKNILHRDLKPDNILLDTKGHSHITDFNIATKIDPTKLPRSQSGTLAYMAPEVFKGKGYAYSVDWWGLGVILYECLYGKRPFKGQNNEQLTMSIISPQDVRFPTCNSLTKYPVKASQDCLMFLKGLLTKDPNQRLGCRPGIGLDELWDHPWLEGIEWDKLERKEYLAPFVPDSDRANFDATYDLEELLLEDNPLVHKKKKKKDKNESKQKSHNTSAHSKHSGHKTKLETEFEYIEKHFRVYDSSMFDRVKDLIERENLFSQLPPEIQKIASQAANVNANYNGKGPSGIVAAKLREKKLQVILFQQHMELQRQMEQKQQMEAGNELNGTNTNSTPNINEKDVHNMNDLQAYYKKHIKANTSLSTINTNLSNNITIASPVQNQTPSSVTTNTTILNYTQSLNHSNYVSSLTDKNKNAHRPSQSSGSSGKPSIASPQLNAPMQPYTASISPVIKSPIIKSPNLASPSMAYINTNTENNTKNINNNNNGGSSQNDDELELQEISLALKQLNTTESPTSPKIITVPQNTTGQQIQKMYYSKSPQLASPDHMGSPYTRYAPATTQPQKGNKTPTLEYPVFLANNEGDGIPVLPVIQDLKDFPDYYPGRTNSPPLVDTPPRTASVGVLREIIPNPYIKKNMR